MSEGTHFVAQSDDNLGRLALIEAIRANTDAVSRLSDQTKEQGGKIDGIKDAIGHFDTRLQLLERDTLSDEVARLRKEIEKIETDHDARIKPLEIAKTQSEARLSLIDWSFKNWPGVIGFVALIIVMLISTGRLGL